VAPVTDQASAEFCPVMIHDGVAAKLATTGAAPTFAVTAPVVEPPLLVAVMVYSVVAVGVTVTLEFVTDPTNRQRQKKK
jgi:hypothetical protein